MLIWAAQCNDGLCRRFNNSPSRAVYKTNELANLYAFMHFTHTRLFIWVLSGPERMTMARLCDVMLYLDVNNVNVKPYNMSLIRIASYVYLWIQYTNSRQYIYLLYMMCVRICGKLLLEFKDGHYLRMHTTSARLRHRVARTCKSLCVYVLVLGYMVLGCWMHMLSLLYRFGYYAIAADRLAIVYACII